MTQKKKKILVFRHESAKGAQPKRGHFYQWTPGITEFRPLVLHV